MSRAARSSFTARLAATAAPGRIMLQDRSI
jgi:hypothetical protein